MSRELKYVFYRNHLNILLSNRFPICPNNLWLCMTESTDQKFKNYTILIIWKPTVEPTL